MWLVCGRYVVGRWLVCGRYVVGKPDQLVHYYRDADYCVLFSHQKSTKYSSVEPVYGYRNVSMNGSSVTEQYLVSEGSDQVPSGTKSRSSMNVLGLVVFSVIFGIVLGRTGEKGEPLKAFFSSLNEVIMRMITIVMW